ncbi:HupE/UreJ family protein [Roseivivax sediminis]|uniref:Urease accessory protein n=1 Tax=Roseivivax sediminis TaxID=936889 RepID=A0A1I1W540_9RHOB|nr:HupE/UreJ family protein [Roseivivax sediminis]SFD90277.1 urease accessory protein [Roseivivax sediminis]
MTRFALALAAALAAGPAFAHLDPGAHGSFAAGASHPVFGTDHVLAMVAVGLWAAMLGGRALWALPAAFVGAMVFGFIVALGGLPLPVVEPMIVASVLVLGLLTAAALRLPLGAAAGIVGLLGVFHGHAHGAEMGGASALAYLAGFALATAGLHAAGVAAGMVLTKRAEFVLRGLGAGVALAGSALLVAG